jgi:putative heme-binding domain-containing protein
MLATVLDSLAPFTAKEQALWALAAIEGDAAETALRDALAADATCVVVLAARVCGARRCRSAARGLERLLGHERAQVRQAAAEALAHCGDRSSLPQIFASLASTDEAVTRHSLIYAIHRLAATNDLLQLAQEAEADVRSVSLRLLDQPPRSAVPLAAALAAIGSPDARLREAGIFVVRRHPEWSDVIADTLRQWLASPKLPPELDPAVYELVSELLANRSISGVAAESLAGYQAAGQGERIGRLLQAIERSRLREIPGELVGALKQLIDDRDAAVRSAAMRTIGVLGIVQLDRELSAIAADARQPTPCRLAALHALRGRRADAIQDGWDVLVAGLAADAPAVDRLMAFEVISVGQLTKEQLREFLPLVAGDPLMAPSGLIPLLQRSLVDAPVGDVFDYVDAALRGGWMPSAADVQPLLDKLVTFDADRTAQLQEMIDVATGGQRERLQSLTPLLSSGDVNRGRSVFMTSQAACAKCHRIGREGGSIGPELTRIGAARTARDLLESIVVPAATIAQGYELHQLVTTDGRSLVGAIIGQDDAHLLLRNTSGAEQRIARSDIEQIQRSSGSIMPDGLDRVLTQDELRDVIAYLVSLR